MKTYHIHLQSDEVIKVLADTHWFSEDSGMLILGVSDGTDYADASFVMPLFNLKYFHIWQEELSDKEVLH